MSNHFSSSVHRIVIHVIMGSYMLCIPYTFALQSDRNEATQLSADKAEFDDVAQQYLLFGNAKITKGTLSIKGAKAVIVVDPEGYQKINVSSGPKHLAYFSQKMDGPGNYFSEGQGETILYDAKSETLLIKGQASVKRRSGLALKDKIIAQEINYDLASEKYRASATSRSAPVKSILAPKNKTSDTLIDPK